MIGVFDSGSGGLSVLRELRKLMPQADVVYFGDIKNAPYGVKTQKELSELTVQAIKLLRARGAERILSACNSVSASLAISLYDVFSLGSNDLIEMVGPTVAHFRGNDKRILLVATQATISSGLYQDAFRTLGKEIEAIAIPELAGAIEFGLPEKEVRAIIQKALPASILGACDVLVLGCTHYPLALPLFEEVTRAFNIELFDPAVAVAHRAQKEWPQEAQGTGNTTFLISKDSEFFRQKVSTLFPAGPHTVEVLMFEVEPRTVVERGSGK